MKRQRLSALFGAACLVFAQLSYAQVAAGSSAPPGIANPFQMAPLRADAPKPSADPHNLGGYYFMRSSGILLPGIRKDHPPFNAAGLEIFRQRIADRQAGRTPDDPQVLCKPMNAVRMFGSGFPQWQIIQTPHQITLLLMEDHIVRRIFLNAKHPHHITPTARGDSIGHWQGDTLLVDTIGFKDGGWLDETGTPADHNEHLTERIRKLDGGQTLEDLVTVEDPTLFTMPISFRSTFAWNPDASWDEIICEEGNRDAGDAQSTSSQGVTR